MSTMKKCGKCGRIKVIHARGLCDACYSYESVKGHIGQYPTSVKNKYDRRTIVFRSRVAMATIKNNVSPNAYMIFESKEDNGFVAIHCDWPMLSGIADTPMKALFELTVAIELALTVDAEE